MTHLSTRFRDRLRQKFGDRLYFHSPLDESAGQQNARDLSGNLLQGDYEGNVALGDEKLFPGLDGTAVGLDGSSSRVRNIGIDGAGGDFRFLAASLNFQIHIFVRIDTDGTSVILGTGSVSASDAEYGGIGVGTISDRALRCFIYGNGQASSRSAISIDEVFRLNTPYLLSITRNNGEIKLSLNGVEIAYASNNTSLNTYVGAQDHPFSLFCEPARISGLLEGVAQDVIVGTSYEDGDVDFIYREAIRGMSLWDWFSQVYPTCDVFCEFDEDAGGSTVVNRAGEDGLYGGNISLGSSRVSARTGLSANFDGVSGYAQLPTDLDYIQKTGVFTLFATVRFGEDFTGYRWIAGTQAVSTQSGWQWRISPAGDMQVRYSDGSGYTMNRVVNVGEIAVGESVSLSVVGDGATLSFYRDGVFYGAQSGVTNDVSGSWDVFIAGNSPLNFQLMTEFRPGLFFSAPVTMQAHEIEHVDKLTQLGGYFDRPATYIGEE